MKKIIILFSLMFSVCISSGEEVKVWNNPDKFIQQSQTDLQIARKSNDKPKIAASLRNIGLGYEYLSNYDKALEYYMQSSKIYENLGDKKGIAKSLNSIGMIYKKVRNHHKALEYYQKALKIYRSLDDKQGLANCLTYMGNIYYHLVEYDKALVHFAEALEIYEEIGDNKGITFPLNNTGTIYKKMGENDKALEFFLKSLSMSESTGEKWGIANTSNNIGELYAESGDYQKALKYLKNAETISKAIKAKDLLSDTYERLSQLYLYKGDRLNHLEYYKRYADIKDSIFSREINQNIAELQTNFEVEKKEMENEILRLRLEKQQLFLLAIIIILIIISGFTYWIVKEKKKSERLLLNILPDRVARELKKTGKTEPESFENVTVCFSDIVNFTQITSELEPKYLTSELNDIFTAFDDIITKYNGERIETKGDAYLAVCGMPEPSESHAENMIQAATEMIDFMEQRAKQAEIPWQIRIGIHTGKVVGGVVGIRKYSYCVFGDTINTAARMEENSQSMKINISEVTYQRVKDELPKFQFVPREPIEVKGKGEMMMYFVDKEKT